MRPFTLVTATGFFLTVVLALMADSAPADLYTPEPVNAVPTNGSASQQQGYCNDVCSQLVNSNGQILGLSGSVGWSVADDLWCANHGSQTNPLVGPSPVPNAAPPPVGSCPVAMEPGDTNCDQVVSEESHCQWHNGQLEQQCEAYETDDKGVSSEKVILDLDIAATGTCAAGCAMSAPTGGAAMAACTDAGLLASTTELIETLSMKSSEMSKVISAATGALGIGKSLYPLMTGAEKPGQLFLGEGNGSGTDQAAKSATNKKGLHNAACQSALLFAAMTGMRYNNISSQESSQKSACSTVMSLASTASTISSGGMPVSYAGGGSTGVTSGGATGATEGASSSLTCIGSGGSVTSCTGASTGAADVAGLSTGGLAQQVAPMASQLASAPVVTSGGNAGNAAGAAASGAGAPGDIANALSTVASAAQQHSQALFDKSGEMASGGDGEDEGGSQQPNPMAMLASLLGQKGAQRTPSGGMTVYQSSQNTDIWHTNSPDNLFQIVSDRIQKDQSRVQ